MTIRLAGLVCLAWIALALVWSSQMTLGANLQGATLSFQDATNTAFLNALPWIPSTLLIIWVARRFPLQRSTWRRTLLPHVVAFPVSAFVSNAFVVLGFWMSAGQFQGFGALARNAAFWMSVRLHIAGLIYLAVAGLTQTIRHYQLSRDRELRIARLESSLAKARVDALNAQLRPHFLFNTLHTIGQLWRSDRADEADRLLDHLGALFERVQKSTSEMLVPLEEELRMTEDYLAIESARFSDRLRVAIDPSEESLSCLVPPLTLQPLVENAIRHGISQSSSSGRIEVRTHVVADTLHIHVTDDGPGLKKDSPSRGTGTGLGNLERRLKEMFGTNASLSAGAASPDGGFRVDVEMPADQGALTLAPRNDSAHLALP